jgi:hypothetical protein
MNRIILIGNGFDLAHSLKTSYKHFIDDFWKKKIDKINELIQNNKTEFYDGDIYFNVKDNFQLSKPITFDNLMTFLDLKNNYADYHKIGKGFLNKFLQEITSKSLINWVDIEEEYYQQIKNIVQEKPRRYSDEERKRTMKKLNEDFEKIKQELEKYLSKITDEDISKIEKMYDVFFENLKFQDFPSSKENLLLEYVCDILKNSSDKYYKEIQDDFFEIYKKTFGFSIEIKSTLSVGNLIELYNKKKYYKEHCLNKIYPRGILILNFNYTNTESLYSKYEEYIKNKFGYIFNNDLPFFRITPIHIHGKLNCEVNPIIFGYGDELADEYKEIEKLNDNDFLKNVKSIEYLKTDNYRRLLSFADSDYFQIYILGHSCGISDRTLLNTLFEHKNCVSIKPFFYEQEKEDKTKTNDYEKITINISRNFNDKKLFREKVVNKTYCEPLPQIK